MLSVGQSVSEYSAQHGLTIAAAAQQYSDVVGKAPPESELAPVRQAPRGPTVVARHGWCAVSRSMKKQRESW